VIAQPTVSQLTTAKESSIKLLLNKAIRFVEAKSKSNSSCMFLQSRDEVEEKEKDNNHLRTSSKTTSS
jgi:hypothetical protein